MHLLHAVHVNLQGGDTLVKPKREGSVAFEGVAIFDVPDLRHFDVHITATLDDEFPRDTGSIVLGIVPADLPFSRLTTDMGWTPWCKKEGAFLLGTGRFNLFPALTSQRLDIQGRLVRGSTLSMSYSSGTLSFRMSGGDWHSAETKYSSPPRAEAKYRPCIMFDSEDWPLVVNIGRRRGRSQGNVDGTFVSRDERIWTDRKFTDAMVVCENVTFDVHRAILCASSPVFERAFSVPMREAQSACFVVQESVPAAVEAMLRFVYTGTFPDDVSEVICALVELAVQYELHELCRIAVDTSLRGMTCDNVRERAKTLKRHAENEHVQNGWKRMLEVLSSNRALLASVV
eukprot:TRINITY_DN25104_c0_g1_i1.p1 TRINITY_DN25104_c0_g1~~TRINITY_DN25104_c0_g1_i1.p1  ORF type:complete len:344 (-),score=48.79 TRINITY_DN25104_c0_g1_i1:254-1285(-)